MSDQRQPADAADPTADRRLLTYLAVAMVAAGQPVHEVDEDLAAVGARLGYADIQVESGPSAVMLALAAGEHRLGFLLGEGRRGGQRGDHQGKDGKQAADHGQISCASQYASDSRRVQATVLISGLPQRARGSTDGPSGLLTMSAFSDASALS